MLGGDTLAGLRVRIGADIKDFQKTAGQIEKAIKPIADRLQQVGKSLSMYVTTPLLAAGAASIKLAGDLEQARTNFEVMLGSAQKASAFLKDLERFAASTPFEFSELIGASERLLAFGFASEQVVPMLTTIGDAARGSAEKISRITVALGQMQAKGKVSTEEVLQLTEAGIPAFEILQEKLKLSTKQMENLGNAGISAESAIQALLQGLDERFGGTMEKSASNINLLFSNLFDNIQLIATDVGDVLIETFDLKAILRSAIDGLDRLREGLASLRESNPGLVKFGAIMAGIAVVIGPILLGLGALVQILPLVGAAFTAATGPVGLVVAAVAALVVAAVDLYVNWEKRIRQFKQLFTGLKMVLVAPFVAALNGLEQFLGAVPGIGPVVQEAAGRAREYFYSLNNEMARTTEELAFLDLVGSGVLKNLSAGLFMSSQGTSTVETFTDAFGRLLKTIKEGVGSGSGSGGVFAPIADGAESAVAAVDKLRTRIAQIMDAGAAGTFLSDRYGRLFAQGILNKQHRGAGPDMAPVTTVPGLVGMPTPEEVDKLKAAIDAATPSITAAQVAAAEWGAAMRSAVTDATHMMVDGLAWAIGDAIAGFESLGQAVKRIMQQVIASVTAAVARVIILKTLLSVFGGGSGFFGGIISSVAASGGVTQGWGSASGLVSSSAVSGANMRTSQQAIAVRVVPTVLPSGDLLFASGEGTRRQVAGVLG